MPAREICSNVFWLGSARTREMLSGFYSLKYLRRIVEPAKSDIQETLEIIGSPTYDDLKQGQELGRRFAEKIKNFPQGEAGP